jgi:hypothetical protein
MKTWVRHACVVAIVVAAALPQLGAQRPATGRTNGTSTLTADQALPLTCVQAWVVSGQSYPAMLAIVTTLAKVSLANRELTFPNTREAGIDAGRGIGQDCKADPRALLYAIVDKHVRRVAEAAP